MDTFICEECEKDKPISESVVSENWIICQGCLDDTENVTGYCSIECRMSGKCDQSC